MGLSENRVYSQWNSHLIGIMISKTIGFRGTQHFQTHPYTMTIVTSPTQKISGSSQDTKPWAEWSATSFTTIHLSDVWVTVHHVIHHCKIIALHFLGDSLAIRIFNSILKYRTAEPPSPVSLNGRCQHVVLAGEKTQTQLLGEHQVTGSCTERKPQQGI